MVVCLYYLVSARLVRHNDDIVMVVHRPGWQ